MRCRGVKEGARSFCGRGEQVQRGTAYRASGMAKFPCIPGHSHVAQASDLLLRAVEGHIREHSTYPHRARGSKLPLVRLVWHCQEPASPGLPFLEAQRSKLLLARVEWQAIEHRLYSPYVLVEDACKLASIAPYFPKHTGHRLKCTSCKRACVSKVACRAGASGWPHFMFRHTV